MKLENEHYMEYGLKMDTTEYDRYLAKKTTEQFDEVDYLPLIFSEQCTLDETWKRLLDLAAGTDAVSEHEMLLKRLKEINYNNRLADDFRNIYIDNKIYSLYLGIEHETELMADIMAMRIVVGNSFNPNVVSVQKTAFQTQFANDDDAFVKRVANELLYYSTVILSNIGAIGCTGGIYQGDHTYYPWSREYDGRTGTIHGLPEKWCSPNQGIVIERKTYFSAFREICTGFLPWNSV